MTEDANGLSRGQVAQWFHERSCTYLGRRALCSGDCGYQADDALGSGWLAAMLADAEKRGEDRGRAEGAAAAWEAVAAEIVAAGEAGRAEGRRDALAAYVGTAAQEGTTTEPPPDKG